MNPTQHLSKTLGKAKQKLISLQDQNTLLTRELSQLQARYEKLQADQDDIVAESVELSQSLEELHESIEDYCGLCSLRDEPFCATHCTLYKARIRAERR